MNNKMEITPKNPTNPNKPNYKRSIAPTAFNPSNLEFSNSKQQILKLELSNSKYQIPLTKSLLIQTILITLTNVIIPNNSFITAGSGRQLSM